MFENSNQNDNGVFYLQKILLHVLDRNQLQTRQTIHDATVDRVDKDANDSFFRCPVDDK